MKKRSAMYKLFMKRKSDLCVKIKRDLLQLCQYFAMDAPHKR